MRKSILDEPALKIEIDRRRWSHGEVVEFRGIKNGRTIAFHEVRFTDEASGFERFLEDLGHFVQRVPRGGIEKPRHLRGRDDA
ncbi:hypothetical protein [Neorhizobium sp. DAR64860/K0K1]|uniref:hypothetical protein n=1 Tax=Neorhizobium sp. DAR64860/K0K1 TaxID=3421955 RepID=UPI003D2DC775